MNNESLARKHALMAFPYSGYVATLAAKAEQAILAALDERSAEGGGPAICPSCRASDNDPYTDASGKSMRACGRCMIQWQVGAPSGAAATEAKR